MKRALITGITGQDGSYLAEGLLGRDYEVWGTLRRSSSFNTGRIDHIFDDLRLVYADLTDPMSLQRAINEAEPDEIYNMGAQSHVAVSFIQPEYTFNVNAIGAITMMNIALDRQSKTGRQIRFYQGSSSEMYGNAPMPDNGFNENSPMLPVSPYGISKLAAHRYAAMMRQRGLYIVSGILFNHESPRRGETFVTRKITRAATRIASGLQNKLSLGNLNAIRDFGHAKEYMECVVDLMGLDSGGSGLECVIGTSIETTISEILNIVFQRCAISPDHFVVIEDRLKRPVELHRLKADCSKAQALIGWKSTATIESILNEMIESDLRLAHAELDAKRLSESTGTGR